MTHASVLVHDLRSDKGSPSGVSGFQNLHNCASRPATLPARTSSNFRRLSPCNFFFTFPWIFRAPMSSSRFRRRRWRCVQCAQCVTACQCPGTTSLPTETRGQPMQPCNAPSCEPSEGFRAGASRETLPARDPASGREGREIPGPTAACCGRAGAAEARRASVAGTEARCGRAAAAAGQGLSGHGLSSPRVGRYERHSAEAHRVLH